MSRSSAAWKPSSAASSFLLALRDAFPWAFAALLVAFAAFLFVVPAARALLPAFGIMAPALAVAFPIALSRRTAYPVVPILASSLAAFALMLPHYDGNGVVAYLQAFGATGIFLAILAVAIAVAGYALARTAGAVAAVALVALLVFGAHANVAGGIAALVAPMARLGDSLPALALIVVAQMLLWFVGVHGPAMLSAILTPVYLTLQMQNTAAFSAHEPLPHVVVASIFLFVFPGGSGATLPLVALLAFSRVPRLRRLGRVVALPALANVNEPLIFGLPIVLNPVFAVPFVLAPLVLSFVTYFAMVVGFVARPAFYVPPLVPAPIATYLATLDWRAPVLVAVNVAIATLIYYPFVRAYERSEIA